MNAKLLISGAVALALCAGRASADAEWELNPSVEAGYLYDDNFRLTSASEIAVQGPLVDAALEMRALTQQGEFSFTPRVRATYFPNEQDLDTVDYFGVVDWQRESQRLRTSVNLDVAQQDVVNSEQPDADAGGDLGEPGFGDAGRVFVKNRRLRANLRPTMEYELSERRALVFEAGVSHVEFDDQIADSQVDYDAAGLAGGLRARISERTSLTTRLRGQRYEFDNAEETTAYGAELQWDTRSATETRTFLRIGAQNVEPANGDAEIAWLAGGGFNMPIGRNEIFADLSRNVGPSSAGLVITRDALRLRFTRAMTPRLSFVAGLRGTHDEAVDPDSTFETRTYASGDVGLQWRWQEEFSLHVAYDYTWQEFEDSTADAATSSGAMISVVYQPVQRRRSRTN